MPDEIKPEKAAPAAETARSAESSQGAAAAMPVEGPTGVESVSAKAAEQPLAAEAEPAAQTEKIPEKQFRQMSRRQLLSLSPLLLAGAFAIPRLRTHLLDQGLKLSDWASDQYFRSSRLAPVFADSELVPVERFPYNGYDVIDPGVDLDSWSLTVEGLVQKPSEYSLDQITALPKISQNVRHVCVEGWDAIGNFAGARASDFLRLVGGDTSARFVEVECADDYYESYDMASFLHPQTLLCYEMYGNPLDRGHGAPLRLNIPNKLGYKQSKYLTTLRVTNVLKPDKKGYWEDQGYSWFAGM